MIDNILKILLIANLLIIFYQDSKSRLVYWFLYLFAGMLFFSINVLYLGFTQAVVNSLINLALVLVVLAVCFFYSRLVLHKTFINMTMGVGDILLFLFLSFTFSTVPFILFFVFSLIFSLVLHIYLKNKSEDKTVPLAGYISLFFAVVYMASLFFEPKYFFA